MSFYQEEKSYSLSLSDLSGKGIDRAVNYLNKVAGLNVSKTSQEWNHVKKVQKVRNVIVHQEGKLIDAQGNQIKDVINYVNESKYLSGKKSILICEGFLFHVAALYDSFFKLIDNSINEKQSKA